MKKIEIAVTNKIDDSTTCGFYTLEEAREFINNSEEKENLFIEYVEKTSETIKSLEISVEDIENVAEKINASDIWNSSDLAKLCEFAGLAEEFENADGENFESVVYNAAKILGVII